MKVMRIPLHRAPILALAAAVVFILGVSAGAMEAEDCMGCHCDKSIAKRGRQHLYIDPAKFAGTPHAQEGCPSCHASVSDSHPDDGVRPSRASCKDCHEDVEAEYAKSVHGFNAICTDCHSPHAVMNPLAVSGFDINRQCADCHDRTTVLTTHGKWLPQAALHIDALPCITCHTGSEDYVINFYIETRGKNAEQDFRVATRQELEELAGTKTIETLIDRNSDNKITLEELKRFHRDARGKGVRLWGMMMPEKVTHSYEILDNRWDCTFCHASGPEAMQVSYVAFPEPTGGYTRVPVEKGAVLDLLYGTPDFYMMGATRNATLDKIGLVIIVAGLIMPVGHGSLRLLTRKNRKEHDHGTE
jgi:predicted CXXCH cytochrome family protein